MAADPALLAEAYQRGLLPPPMAAAYEEAQKRGLVGSPDVSTSAPDVTPQKGIVGRTIDYLTGPSALEQSAQVAQQSQGMPLAAALKYKMANDPVVAGLAAPSVTEAIGGGLGFGRAVGRSALREVPRAEPSAAGAPEAASPPPTSPAELLPEWQQASTAARAERIVQNRLDADAKATGETATDKLFTAAKTPEKPLTLADVGDENVSALLGKIARQPGEARAYIKQFLEDRDASAGDRAIADVNEGLGSGSAPKVAEDLMAARTKAAQPLYEKYREAEPMNPEEMGSEGAIGSLLDRPSMKVGMANARKIAAEKGVSENTLGITLDKAGDPVFAKTPTWDTLDYIKAGLDDVVESYRDKTTGKLVLDRYGKAANDTRQQFIQAVDKMNPAYAEARAAWGGPSQAIDAVNFGRDIFKMEPHVINSRMSRLSPADKDFARIGAAETARKIIAQTGAAGDEARRLVGNAYAKQQLRGFFDNEAEFNRLVNNLSAESRMVKTKFGALGGSQTAARLAEDTSPGLDAAVDAAGAAVHAVHGNVVGAALRGGRAIKNALATRNPETNLAVAKLLLSRLGDANSPGLQMLAGKPPNSLAAARGNINALRQ